MIPNDYADPHGILTATSSESSSRITRPVLRNTRAVRNHWTLFTAGLSVDGDGGCYGSAA